MFSERRILRAWHKRCIAKLVAYSLTEFQMAGDNSFKPGEIVKTSGIYAVVHDDGKETFEVTCVEGEHFPPTRSGKGAHFELKYAATHAHRHGELKGSEARQAV